MWVAKILNILLFYIIVISCARQNKNGSNQPACCYNMQRSEIRLYCLKLNILNWNSERSIFTISSINSFQIHSSFSCRILKEFAGLCINQFQLFKSFPGWTLVNILGTSIDTPGAKILALRGFRIPIHQANLQPINIKDSNQQRHRIK